MLIAGDSPSSVSASGRRTTRSSRCPPRFLCELVGRTIPALWSTSCVIRSSPNDSLVEPVLAQDSAAHIVYSKSRTLPILRIRLPIRVGEFYFSFTPPGEDCDIHVGLCLKEPRSGWSSHQRSTRIIDLDQPEDALLRACSKSNRYKIERAGRRDNVQTAFLSSSDERGLLEFVNYYDSFAASKGVPPLRRDQFNAVARAGNLVISTARTEDGSVLAAHAYFVDQSRARLTHSASMFRLEADSAERNRIGRANRLLHWDDMIRFRASGVKTYDLGGWYTGRRDQALLRINSFKEEFGGQVVHEWDIFRAGSTRGSLYLKGRNLAAVADVA
jgi:hypothetical protein